MRERMPECDGARLSFAKKAVEMADLDGYSFYRVVPVNRFPKFSEAGMTLFPAAAPWVLDP